MRDGQRNPMEELSKLTGIKEAKEPSAALLILVDGAFTEHRLFNRHSNGIKLYKAAVMMIEAYASNPM
ncbi:hypothetical protein [Mastigocoleus sp. MO_188.B34]|uniref:hypothetical protein n=1 Tax=Mastigocoleus sp. MO_188.B34 TaxID=3036635 RepID=UPI00263091EE|nr:hypothetical protein [Mastigocoleus sp. MO_188.B34]MDJ0698062.1 hypothetical protein [Mastigocoleus sp. MO_188.B34]